MVNKSKAKGTAAETAIVNYMRKFSSVIERRTLSGSSDKGDIAGVIGTVIEVKNAAAMALGAWVDEAARERDNAQASLGVVWHKRRGTTNPAEWYVTMTGADLMILLVESGRVVKGVPIAAYLQGSTVEADEC